MKRYKPDKHKYRLVVVIGEITIRNVFEEYNDNRAKAKFFAKIRSTQPGSKVTIDRFDRRSQNWIFIQRGGKEALSQCLKF